MKSIFKSLALATLIAVVTSGASAAEKGSDTLLNPLTVVQIADGRSVLADSRGFTVYTFDNDKTSESTCYDGCAVVWPPVLLTKATELLQPPLGVTTRRDGKIQITYDGHPVYLYFKDKKVGDITGDNVGGVWHILVAE